MERNSDWCTCIRCFITAHALSPDSRRIEGRTHHQTGSLAHRWRSLLRHRQGLAKQNIGSTPTRGVIKDSRAENHWCALPSLLPPVNSLTASYVPKWTACAGPAPRITEDTPRQSARTPSVEDIRVNALPIPVYTAAGEVENTCIRVLSHESEHSERVQGNGTHFYAVDWEHHRVLRDTSLGENARSLAHACGERTRTRAPANMLTYEREKKTCQIRRNCAVVTETRRTFKPALGDNASYSSSSDIFS